MVENPYRTGFVEARFASRQKGDFQLTEPKIQNWCNDSKFGSLYWVPANTQSMCRLAFFLADSKEDLPRITHSPSAAAFVRCLSLGGVL